MLAGHYGFTAEPTCVCSHADRELDRVEPLAPFYGVASFIPPTAGKSFGPAQDKL